MRGRHAGAETVPAKQGMRKAGPVKAVTKTLDLTARREIHWLNRRARKMRGAALRETRERIGILRNRIKSMEVGQ